MKIRFRAFINGMSLLLLLSPGLAKAGVVVTSSNTTDNVDTRPVLPEELDARNTVPIMAIGQTRSPTPPDRFAAWGDRQGFVRFADNQPGAVVVSRCSSGGSIALTLVVIVAATGVFALLLDAFQDALN